MQETWIWSLGQEDPLEKEKATASSILAWEIPWTEDTGGLHGVVRVGHNLATKPTLRKGCNPVGKAALFSCEYFLEKADI